MRDIFICHAGEDKDDIVRPMVEAFTQAGISCWYDEAEIQWGDSITKKVNEGLAVSRYVLVVLSPAFMEKNWPQRELNAVLNQEASSGEVKVLPLLVGSEEEKRQILATFPLLNDKQYLPWDGDLDNIVNSMLSRLGKERESLPQPGSAPTRPSPGLRIPLPRIKKQFSQRDKDLFLRSAFNVVKQYFRDALAKLDDQYEEANTNFEEVHGFKFLCTIYIRGEVANRCKIWIGGFRSSDSIAYYEGEFGIDDNNSFNDILSVADDGQRLGFKPSNMWLGGQHYSEKDLLTAEQVAEYLWRRCTANLG
jgi:hypothetical protein